MRVPLESIRLSDLLLRKLQQAPQRPDTIITHTSPSNGMELLAPIISDRLVEKVWMTVYVFEKVRITIAMVGDQVEIGFGACVVAGIAADVAADDFVFVIFAVEEARVCWVVC